MGSFQPDVRGVDAAVGFKTGGFQPFPYQAGVFHVVGDGFRHLGLAFLRVDGGSAALDDVGCAVELGGVAAVQEAVSVYA